MKRKKNRHSTWLRCASFVAAQLAKTESPSSHEDTKRFGDLATEIDQQQLRISIARSRGWKAATEQAKSCLLYTSPSPRDGLLSRMPSSA